MLWSLFSRIAFPSSFRLIFRPSGLVFYALFITTCFCTFTLLTPYLSNIEDDMNFFALNKGKDGLAFTELGKMGGAGLG